jgi:Fic family protein
VARSDLGEALVACVQRIAGARKPASTAALTTAVGAPRATVQRHLARLVRAGRLTRIGVGPATRYELARRAIGRTEPAQPLQPRYAAPDWSPAAKALRAELQQPLGARKPVSYERRFADAYVPNESALLPAALATALHAEGRMPGQQPAGTYARKVLEPLLIDLAWSSSKLEGNRYSLLDTQELFRLGRDDANAADADAVMLLNHKEAIEFLVDAVPAYGLTVPVVSNLHGILLQGLLADTEALGTVRSKVVNITGTTYSPSQVPALLGEMLAQIVAQAARTKNPAEAAFFLWVNLAYLQPFEDGNKRTSRLAANIPLMLYNCAPLAFLDVDPDDYATAMIGIYERQDATVAAELFAWTYRRSIDRYGAVLRSVSAPDPFRLRYRRLLTEALQAVVLGERVLAQVVRELDVDAPDRARFLAMARAELEHLDVHNCGRFRLGFAPVQRWVARGRPA